MLSGQLTPLSANFVPRQQQYNINEGDPTSSNSQNKFEKIYSNPALVQNLSTTSKPIKTFNNTRIATNSTAAATATISVSEILNITDVKSIDGQLSLYSKNSPITTTSPASDANGRSAALERAYVHDVYENCEEASGPIRPRVSQFLAGLEPGSIVCDVGCGNGKYLTSCNPLIYSIGVDRCFRLAKFARERGGEVAMCDNLELPFRDESFDAVLSLAVVHHFATTERRVGAIRELARILRIGGRVVITVWAFEQRHRRFESQDVLIPWQPPKNRNYTCSDDEDDDDYLPPYHAYTEDSTNSSRSAGDGDSSSLSSSSPGESCYSFVRRAIQKLAGGRKHSWFLDSWNSKDTKNDSSLDYEDAKDLPIELRRLEDFEDFPDPPLSAGLKSRSLGSILNPPPRQIVRSRSSVPSLGAQIPEQNSQQSGSGGCVGHQSPQNVYVTTTGSTTTLNNFGNVITSHPTSVTSQGDSTTSTPTQTTSGGRRPKLVKQKQSLCDEEYQLTDSNLHLSHSNCSSNSSSCCNIKNINSRNIKTNDSKLFLRKQSSLNEELMAESRLREKDRVRRRIQKQMSLNEAFLCRSLFGKRLQIIREGFTTRLKTSTGSLERATKNGFVKIMQNFKGSQFSSSTPSSSNVNTATTTTTTTPATTPNDNTQSHTNNSNNHSKTSTNCTGDSSTNSCNNNNCNNSCNNVNNGIEDQKPRRHSRESGSDSSKDSSLQSDTSIESEDSFASVIYIPRPEQNNQQQINSNNINSNNGNCINNSNSCLMNSSHKIPSVPTSPLVLPCPPTPAHSPAAGSISLSTIPSPAGLSMLSPQNVISISNTLQGNNRSLTNRFTFDEEHILQHKQQNTNIKCSTTTTTTTTTITPTTNVTVFSNNSSRQQHKIQKITRQTIKDLPPIPKFRKHQSLQSSMYKSNFPIVRRSSASPAVPKLMSLEIFNPETDDLDSDSSEPSSPDSIDSVISALKSGTDEDSIQQHQQNVGDITKVQHHHSLDESKLYKHQENINEQYSIENLNVNINQQQCGNKNDNVKLNSEKQILNSSTIVEENHSDIKNDKYLGISKINNINNSNSSQIFCNSNNSNRQEFVDFAEQLSAQLLKELDEKNKLDKNLDVNSIINENDSLIDNPFVNKENCEINELYALREELRERRLMLANLTSQYNQQKSPTPTSSSTSSLSSQTRSFTIHEEENENNEQSVSTYDSRNFKTKYLRKITSSSGYHQYNYIPDTACLIQDDGEGSGREDEYDEMDNGVIMEEDEDQLDGDGDCNVGETSKVENNVTNPCLEDTISSPTQIQLQTQQSTESWGHSNSETSLDSSSQGGGATTHHRYYHVFREGELDALINHHVASLHIVSSTYERASWCVVAEKVQLWTI